MAKPKKDADRRAVVEQMRREQQRTERRKSFMVLGAALLVGAIIIGFAVVQFLKSEQSNSRDLAQIGASTSTSSCQKVVTKPANGNNDHQPEGQKVLYPDAPPAFGPHWGQWLQGSQLRKLYTPEDRPPVERLVHSLEHGHTILWYDDTIAGDDAAMTDLEAIAKQFPSSSDMTQKFIAAPWTADDGEAFPKGTHVALTHWSMGGTNGNPDGQLGIWQYCGGVSGAAVEQFMKDYPYSDSPEPNAP